MILEVNNLFFSYGSHEVVKGVSFQAYPGECLAILGMNGAGKSTLLKCINRIIRPSSGSVLVGDQDVLSLSGNELAKQIGYVSQNCQFEDASVFDAILLGRKPFIRWDVTEHDLKIVQDVLYMMSLEKFASRNVNELSGGERQKVSIARALAQQTPVLLFDEPTSNLDIKNQIEVLDIMKRIVHEKQIIAVVTIHDLNMALRFADKFLVMKDGGIYAFGGREVITEKLIWDVYDVKASLIDYGNHRVLIPD